MYKQLILGVVMVVSLLGAGCASKGASTSSAGGVDQNGNSLTTSGASDTSGLGAAVGSDDTSGLALAQRTIYFDFDSTNINTDGQTIVSHFAKYLVAHPTAKLRLEGHADERGTREYNVGLGEGRASAVQVALVAAGASANQMSVVSYGEERPADPGHDEAAWAKNRRVEIIQL